MSLKGIAKQTLQILEQGFYLDRQGRAVEIRDQLQAAVRGTELFRPDELRALVRPRSDARSRARISVSNETTQVAARRMAAAGDVVLLNFASAKNAGGGFINGAKAQEEDLARASGLHPCLLAQPDYYQVNRAEESMLYTDHLIYSPRIPFFRVRNRELIDEPFVASVITAPAPNAGQHLRRHADDHDSIRGALVRRAGYVLAVARARSQRRLLLGAWGCGVFRNDPQQVARAFSGWLNDANFADAFDEVSFAVLDKSRDRATVAAFESTFSSPAT